MVTSQRVSMCYLKEVGVQYEGDYGIKILNAVDKYDDAIIRNNVICRADFLLPLKGLIVSSEHYEEYRDNFIGIVSGVVQDMDLVSRTLVEMYQQDIVFHKFLYELYYFQDDNKTFLERITEVIGEYIQKGRRAMDSELAAQGYKFVAEHCGYYYFSVKDTNEDKYLSANLEGEVISRAKVWSGLFKRKSAEV